MPRISIRYFGKTLSDFLYIFNSRIEGKSGLAKVCHNTLDGKIEVPKGSGFNKGDIKTLLLSRIIHAYYLNLGVKDMSEIKNICNDVLKADIAKTDKKIIGFLDKMWSFNDRTSQFFHTFFTPVKLSSNNVGEHKKLINASATDHDTYWSLKMNKISEISIYSLMISFKAEEIYIHKFGAKH